MINLDLAFVVQIINFGILVLVLNIFLYKPIRTMLAKRREEISSAREKAESVDQEVQEKVAQYEARLREAKAEASAYRADLVKQAVAEETALLNKARSEAAAALATVRDRIAKEATDARVVLKQQVDVLSGDICEKILGRSL